LLTARRCGDRHGFQDRHRVYAHQFRGRSPTSTVWIGFVDFGDLRAVSFPYDVPVRDSIIAGHTGQRTAKQDAE
jgi:hypothetical protein